ncbi:MAG: hypothetical protein IT236_03070 [Bacteroidia bacterium]|nr:hypothetical protein [Bacteroidia bacterium]
MFAIIVFIVVLLHLAVGFGFVLYKLMPAKKGGLAEVKTDKEPLPNIRASKSMKSLMNTESKMANNHSNLL